jgi:thiopeptide-type bacteriocin biosynthesis protein
MLTSFRSRLLARATQFFRNSERIEEMRYEPEIARYGGRQRIAIAERQFEASSRAVLGALAEGEWSYERALGTALQLHTIFANSIGFGVMEASEFFSDVYGRFVTQPGWMPRGLSQPAAVSSFEQSFKLQEARLLGVVKAVWPALENGVSFTQKWANRWARDNRVVARRLRAAAAQDAGWQQLERSIFISYVHMTNNRAGLLNYDEGFVAYILNRCFAALAAGRFE